MIAKIEGKAVSELGSSVKEEVVDEVVFSPRPGALFLHPDYEETLGEEGLIQFELQLFIEHLRRGMFGRAQRV